MTPLIATLLACSSRSVDRRPDLLVVVIDTLRQDRVGAYGYERDTTPVLDALAARGTRYANARSTGGWTAPAHASLFTGLYPAAHGTTQEHWVLDPHHETLAEVLSGEGYRTVGASGNPMLAARKGYAQGFDVYEESWRAKRAPSRDAHTVQWLQQRLPERTDAPQLVFVNLIGVHSPYDSCGEDCGAFGARPEVGGSADNGWQEHYLGRTRPTPEQLVRLSDLYDAEVRHADRMLGGVLEAFTTAAAGRDHRIVVTSDHGENLGDHGHLDHVFSLYESTVRVPLVLAGTGIDAGTVDDAPVQLHDLFPELLAAAGVSRESQGLRLAEVPDDRAVLLEYYQPVQASRQLERRARTDAERAHLAAYQRPLLAWAEGGWKVIAAGDRAAGPAELYDLGAHPTEAHDAATDHPDRVAELRGRAQAGRQRVSRARAEGVTPEADPETQEALEALGYLE